MKQKLFAYAFFKRIRLMLTVAKAEPKREQKKNHNIIRTYFELAFFCAQNIPKLLDLHLWIFSCDIHWLLSPFRIRLLLFHELKTITQLFFSLCSWFFFFNTSKRKCEFHDGRWPNNFYPEFPEFYILQMCLCVYFSSKHQRQHEVHLNSTFVAVDAVVVVHFNF